MKVLLDTCVWGGVPPELEAAGHDVVWSGDWPEDPGDREILIQAAAEGRILVTLDKDFGELAVAQGMVHSGIIRLVGFRAREQARVLNAVLMKYGAELVEGALVTVEPGRVRIRTR